MDIDSRDLQRVETSLENLTIIRLYQWSSPTVSLGKNQLAESAVDLQYCEEKEIPIVKRPTGGRAVLHDDELTYAVVSNDPDLFPLQNISGTYAVVANALFEGLKSLGILVELADGVSAPRLPGRLDHQKPCFVTASRHEILWQGRKLVGSAQRRLKKSFLQHGSIPLKIDYAEMGRVLGYDAAALKGRMASVSEALAREISFSEVAAALYEGLANRWGSLTER